MAAFLGYLAQSTPVVSGPHGKLPFKGYEPGLTPPEQWDAILAACQERKLLPFFDSAYQGFASGDLERDAAAVRLFADSGMDMLLAQSYAKNLGLYGERVGALSVVCSNAGDKARVESQLKQVIRPMYSNPPAHGAAIVEKVLSDPARLNEWKVELKGMADRILAMRDRLHGALVAKGAFFATAPGAGAGVGAGQSPPPADAAVVRGSGEGAAATGPGAPATFRFGALSCAAFDLGPRLSGLWLAGAGLGPAASGRHPGGVQRHGRGAGFPRPGRRRPARPTLDAAFPAAAAADARAASPFAA